ncbi:MAG: hypothetical protein P8H23_04750 [Flavobacteriaceae bacterium]|nr:hypothetical protein [Flavobacteriaceae bacterium]
MRKMKQYSFESVFDFGQCEGKTLKEVFDKSPSYINWCFQKVDWFCITDDIFNKLPIVEFLRKDLNTENMKWLEELVSIHNNKKHLI